MAFARLTSLEELKPGTMQQFDIGERMVVLCNVDGVVHAMDGRCPHRGGPLGQGALHGKMVVCPWHAWEFDCTTGQYDYNPSLRQQQYAVRVEGAGILVDL